MILITTFIIIPLVFKLISIFLPAKNSTYNTNKSFDRLSKIYSRYDRIQSYIFASSTVVFMVLLFFLFTYLVDLKFSFLADTLFLIKPDDDMIALISFSGGMLLSSLVTIIVAYKLLKTNWNEYIVYLNRKYKTDYYTLTKWTLIFFTIINVFLIFSFTGWFTAFSDQEIKTKGYFSFGTKTYRYSDIIKVKDVERIKAPNGNIVYDKHYIIEFNDGETWNSRVSGFKNYEEDSKIIDLIKDKTQFEPIQLVFDN